MALETYYKYDFSDATDLCVNKDGITGHCTFSKVLRPSPMIGRAGSSRLYSTIIPTTFKTVLLLRSAEPHPWFTRLISQKPGSLLMVLITNVTYTDYYYHYYLPHVTVTRDHILLPSPIRFEAEVVHFGKNSVRIAYKAFTTGHAQKELFTQNDVMARIDEGSRKPEDIMRGLDISPADCPKLDRPPQYLFSTVPPHCRPRMSFVTDDRDVDHNGHINVSAYQVFFDICLEKELELGNLPSFRGIQLSSLIVKDFRVKYANESFLGETLNCFIWNEPENVSIINGELKNGAKIITQFRLDCKIDYPSNL